MKQLVADKAKIIRIVKRMDARGFMWTGRICEGRVQTWGFERRPNGITEQTCKMMVWDDTPAMVQGPLGDWR